MSGKPIALVAGAQGQLGRALVEQFARDHDVIALTRSDLDVTDHRAVMARVTSVKPHVVLNATAYNHVDGAEDDAFTAFNVNAMAVRSLARAAEAANAVLVHYSTDFVFDGETDRPYAEDDQPAPRSVYGQSKLVGEWMAASVRAHYVLRVESLFGGPHAHSTIDTFITALREGREVRAFTDREVSPSFVEDVAAATGALLPRSAPFGLYHCVNSGHDSWLSVARAAAALLKVPAPRIVGVSVHDIKLRAARPRFAALDNRKLTSLGIAMPHWRDALARHIAARSGRR